MEAHDIFTAACWCQRMIQQMELASVSRLPERDGSSGSIDDWVPKKEMFCPLIAVSSGSMCDCGD